ncbi:hypothetical protein Hdeb2414_s1097g00981851 [Helianthus debilis subsp. tardiflorus]
MELKLWFDSNKVKAELLVNFDQDDNRNMMQIADCFSKTYSILYILEYFFFVLYWVSYMNTCNKQNGLYTFSWAINKPNLKWEYELDRTWAGCKNASCLGTKLEVVFACLGVRFSLGICLRKF